MNMDEFKVHLEYIRNKLDTMEANQKELFSIVNGLAVKVEAQRIKSGFIGAITGAVPASIIALYMYLRSLPK